MEQMKNTRRMIDISTELFEGTDSLEIKDGSTPKDNLSIPSFQYKAPVHKIIYKNGVHIKNKNNDSNASKGKNSSLLEKKEIMAVKNIRLKDLQQNSEKARETLASHIRVCRQLFVYACEKCPFITQNKADLIIHHAVHAPIKCPKCSLSFEDEKSFTLHYYKGCKKPRSKDVYTCKVCAFSSYGLPSLKVHMKVHADETVEFGRNTCPLKESNNKFGQGVVVVTAKSLYAKEYDDVADIPDAESSPLRAESDSVKQNSSINSSQDQSIIQALISTNRDHAYSKIEKVANKNSTNLIKHAEVYRNESNSCEIGHANEDSELGIDIIIVSENSKNFNEDVDMYRKEPSTSEIVCTNEDLDLGIDKSMASVNPKNLNELADMYKKGSSDSEIVCTDEDSSSGIANEAASENSTDLNEQVDMIRPRPSAFEIVCVDEDLNLGTDEENPKNLSKQVNVHRKNSSTSKVVCRNEGLNHGIDYRRHSKKKSRNKIIVRYCMKCEKTFDFENYSESRPTCDFCGSKLHLQCTQCYKVMKEYFEAIEHSEADCDEQETLYTQRQVALPSDPNSLRQTECCSNLYVNNLPSMNDNNHRKKILRYCKKCKKNFDLVCYYDERPRCIQCRTKLELKCTLCLELMTEYFVAVEHTELKCNPKKQVRRKNPQQYTANYSFSNDREHDGNETEREITFETAKKRVSGIATSSFSKNCDQDKNKAEQEITFMTEQKRFGRITYNIKSAKVTKICLKCNITAEFDITNRCKTCYRDSIFQCNRCKRNFDNYQKVSKHMWTQCFEEGFYHCLRCTFKSTHRLTVSRHCEVHHPELSDPLGTAKVKDCIEYRATQSNERSSWLPQNIPYQPKIPKLTKRVGRNINVPARYSRTCHHCKTTYSSRHSFIKHLVHCTRPRVFTCEYCPFTTETQLDLHDHVHSCHSNLPSNSADSLLVNSSVDRSEGSPPYKCRYCSHVAQRRAALQMHEVRVHSNQRRESLVLKKNFQRKCKVYQCNSCLFRIVNKLGELRQHILKVHMKGQDASTLPPCARCGWDFQGCLGLTEHLAYCGNKLSMQCRVNLVRLKMKPPAVSSDNLGGPIKEDLAETIEEDLAETITKDLAETNKENLAKTVKEDLAETIKEEVVDLGEFQMEVEL